MLLQSELLNKEFIKQLIINKRLLYKTNITFYIVKSNTTNSLYINFFNQDNIHLGFRISDHYNKSRNMKQFLIDLDKPLTKKFLALLIRTINNIIKQYKSIEKREFWKKLNNLGA